MSALKLKRRAKDDIRDRAILVQVTPRGFTTSRYDKSATKEFESYAGAVDAGKFVKDLFTKEEMSEIMKVQGIARSIHYKYSWQWIEGGLRIMSTAVWDDFSKEINEAQDMLDKAVRGVVKRYDKLMNNAKRRLGKKLFHIEEFPTKEELRDRFKILIRTYPVPDKEDFRADIPEDVIENFEDNTREQYQKAVNEMWGRFRSVLEHAFEQLSKKEGKLFESVVENIKSLTELLPRLNIVEDAKLNELVEMANNAFENVTIEQLRENTGKRKRKARAAKEILDKMADYLGG